MHAGLPGLSRLDHIGFTVPDLDQAHNFLVDVLGCEYMYTLGPYRSDDSDWMSEHLNVHPRAVMQKLHFYRVGGQAVFEVFQYSAPDRHVDQPRNSDVGGHHVAFYVDDLDTAVAYLRDRGVQVCGEPTASSGPSRRPAVDLLPRTLGNAVRAGVLPRRQGVRSDGPSIGRRFRMTTADVEPRTGTPTATSSRIAAYLRQQILTGAIGPGERIRQEDIAERLGASRLPVREALRMLEAEGLTELEMNKGARVPALDMHEVDVMYQMRERLEPLAITESLPHLTEDHLAELADIQVRIESNSDIGAFLDLDRQFHLLSYSGCAIEQLLSSVTRLWNSTQHYRRAFMMISGPGRRWIVNAEHRLVLDAIHRRDAVDADRYLSGHIRRTRIELSKHPEVFRRP